MGDNFFTALVFHHERMKSAHLETYRSIIDMIRDADIPASDIFGVSFVRDVLQSCQNNGRDDFCRGARIVLAALGRLFQELTPITVPPFEFYSNGAFIILPVPLVTPMMLDVGLDDLWNWRLVSRGWHTAIRDIMHQYKKYYMWLCKYLELIIEHNEQLNYQINYDVHDGIDFLLQYWMVPLKPYQHTVRLLERYETTFGFHTLKLLLRRIFYILSRKK